MMPLSQGLMKPGSLSKVFLRWLDQFYRSFHSELMNMRATTAAYEMPREIIRPPQRQCRCAVMPIMKLRNSEIVLKRSNQHVP